MVEGSAHRLGQRLRRVQVSDKLEVGRTALLNDIDSVEITLLPRLMAHLAAEAPGVRVLVRCAYLHELPALRKAGASDVFSEEGEIALAMAEFILRDLGATVEQIDR